MQKRGQVALFVIIGLVVVGLIVALYVAFQGQLRSASSGISQSANVAVARDEIDTAINSCLEQWAEEAVRNAGAYGGYANSPGVLGGICPALQNNNVHDFFEAGININGGGTVAVPGNVVTGGNEYLFYNRNGNTILGVPSFNLNDPDIEYCMDNFITQQIDSSCLNTASKSLEDQGWEVQGNGFGIAVEVKDNVAVNLNYPRRFVRGNDEFTTNDYSYTVERNFRPLIDAANYAYGMVASCNNPENGLEDKLDESGDYYDVLLIEQPPELEKAYLIDIKDSSTEYRFFKFGVTGC